MTPTNAPPPPTRRPRWPRRACPPARCRRLEPYGVATVGDLVAVDPVRLNRLLRRGRGDPPRGQGPGPPVAGQVRRRRHRPRRRTARPPPGPAGTALPDPVSAAELLLAHAGTARAASRRATARLLLGLDPGLDPFGSQNELSRGARRQPGAGRPAGGCPAGRVGGPRRPAAICSTPWRETARQSLADFGGVATVDELADAVRACLPPPPTRTDPGSPTRIAAGLLRLALDRAQALYRAEAGEEQLATRRRGGRIALLATDAALLDPAEALGRAADDLVAQARSAGEPLVPAARAAQRLRDGLDPRQRRASSPRPPRSATPGCCGWPRRWPRTRPCPGRTSCTTVTCP